MSAFNQSKYNLMGYNVTPPANIFLSAKFSETISCVIVTIVNNAYPTVRFYDTFDKKAIRITPGRFVRGTVTSTIANTQAHMLGISWRQATFADTWAKEDMIGNRYFWRKVESADLIDTERINALGYFWQTCTYEETIDVTKAEALGYFWQNCAAIDQFDGSAMYSVNLQLIAQYMDSISGRLHTAEIVMPTAESADIIATVKQHLASKTYVAADYIDLIDAVCDAENNEILTCDLTLSLGPGQTLVIDASTYNVWIDQQNAIYTHSGDWLDEITRDTRSLTITAASLAGYIEASLLITERYL